MKIFYNIGKFILKHIVGIVLIILIGYVVITNPYESNLKNRINDLQSQYKDLSNNYIKLQDKDKDLQYQIDELNQRILILENSRRGIANEQ